MLKKVLIGLGALVLLLVVAVAIVAVPLVVGVVYPVDGEELGDAKARQVFDGYVNVFVLPAGEKGVALIDCGNDAEGEVILKELKRRGLGPEAVRAAFLTHAHPDHIAACHLFPNAKIYAFEGDVKLAAGEVRAKGRIPSMIDTPVEKRAKVTDLLSDGVPVDVDGLVVTPYHLPGHTAGSAGFLAGGVLFLGDNAMAKTSGIEPAPALFTDDLEQNKRSLKLLVEKLRAAGTVKVLAFGHSGAVNGLDALAKAYQQ